MTLPDLLRVEYFRVMVVLAPLASSGPGSPSITGKAECDDMLAMEDFVGNGCNGYISTGDEESIFVVPFSSSRMSRSVFLWIKPGRLSSADGSSDIEFFISSLSRRTSTLALKYSSKQSSSLMPLPSGSGGTARFNSLSYTTLWSSSSLRPWWKRST